MNTGKARHLLEEFLSPADVHINGNNPWDLRVYNDKFFSKALVDGSLGAGQAYVENWWDCLRLDEFYYRIISMSIDQKMKKNRTLLSNVFLSKLFNRQTISKAYRAGQRHYNIGNELFAYMLDKRMIYTCGYWHGATTLDQAQENKLELICLKLNLKPDMRILDIGCGWGGFAKFAADKFKVQVTGITVSHEQAKLARKTCEGLPVDIQLMDYREVKGEFDRVVSLGMFEHVGYKNYRTFMNVAHRSLRANGLFLLHSIGSNTTSTWTDPWINHYIFPGTMLPSIRQIGRAIERLFVMEDWHNFSADYDKTLMAWHENFISHWESIKDHYDDKFYRMWNYYLLSCAGSFRARKNQLWQIVLSKGGVPGGYVSVR